MKARPDQILKPNRFFSPNFSPSEKFKRKSYRPIQRCHIGLERDALYACIDIGLYRDAIQACIEMPYRPVWRCHIGLYRYAIEACIDMSYRLV